MKHYLQHIRLKLRATYIYKEVLHQNNKISRYNNLLRCDYKKQQLIVPQYAHEQHQASTLSSQTKQLAELQSVMVVASLVLLVELFRWGLVGMVFKLMPLSRFIRELFRDCGVDTSFFAPLCICDSQYL